MIMYLAIYIALLYVIIVLYKMTYDEWPSAILYYLHF